MSLVAIYLCCDDGLFYRVSYLEGDRWAISFDDEADDELIVPARPRLKGEQRHADRSVETLESLLARVPLPIFRRRLSRTKEHPPQAVFAIDWQLGVAFPRSLLPATSVGVTAPKSECVMSCYTVKHGRAWRAAAKRSRS